MPHLKLMGSPIEISGFPAIYISLEGVVLHVLLRPSTSHHGMGVYRKMMTVVVDAES